MLTPTRNQPDSPQARARLAGLFYLLNIATIFAAIGLFRGITVPGDATATAANISAHLVRYRIAFAAQVISTSASIAVAALLYGLLKPVNAGVSLTATLLRVVACALAGCGYLFQLAPLVVAGAAHGGIGAPETQAIVRMFAGFQSQARNISIAFFGCQFLVLAYLVARSTFLPRVLALLLAAAGAGGLLFAGAPTPPALLLEFAPVGLVAELSLALWLAVKGVDADRWREQAS